LTSPFPPVPPSAFLKKFIASAGTFMF
jgi:hypothetical protein